MANSDKNIVIRPSIGSTVDQPNIRFTGSDNIPTTLTVQNDGNISYAGTLTAYSYYGDGRNVSNTNGFSTSLSSDPSSPLYRIYKETKILTVQPGIHTVQSDSNSDNLAFTKAESITISSGATFHVSSGTTVRTNIIKLFPANEDLDVTANNLNVLGIATIATVDINAGVINVSSIDSNTLNVTGIATLGILTVQQVNADVIVGASVTASEILVESSDGTEIFSVTGIGTTSTDPIFEIVDTNNTQIMSVFNNAVVKFFPEVDGYVGIGTTNPSAELHVVGVVSATQYYGGGANLEDVKVAITTTTSSLVGHTTTFATIGLSTTITPRDVTKKVYIDVSVPVYMNKGASVNFQEMEIDLRRNGTSLMIHQTGLYVGTVISRQDYGTTVSFHHIDSPSTVGITTYEVFARSQNTTTNYWSSAKLDFSNTGVILVSPSRITLMEVD